MLAKEFIELLKEQLDGNGDAFIANMEKLKKTDAPPHEWAKILIAWLELDTEDAARLYYGEHYNA